MNSRLYMGHVRHRRSQPRVHDFRYALFMAYLDLDELETLDDTISVFSVNRNNLFSFFDSDHIDGHQGAIQEKLRAFLAHHSINLSGGKIFLLTQCRIFGYVFNPISLYYCYRKDGQLAVVVAEVHNTFGECYLYLLQDDPENANRSSTTQRCYRTKKALHVSPFLSMNCSYEFTLSPVNDRVAVGITQHEGSEHVLDVQLWGQSQPFTTSRVVTALVRYPFLTLKTIGAIHFEALRLYLKRLKLFHQPSPSAAQQTQATLLRTLEQDTKFNVSAGKR